jgi:KDO2-lipid IV(A) lauroyltransferase
MLKGLGRSAGYGLLRLSLAATPLLPLAVLQWTGRRIGDLIRIASRRRREIADRNLRIAFGHALSETERMDILAESFRQFGMFPFECMKFGGLSNEQALAYMVVDELDVRTVNELFALGRGVIFVSAHYGNFELAARFMATLGHPVVVVVRSARDTRTNDLMNRLRLRNGMVAVRRDVAARPMVAALRRGECVAILADQNAEDIYVPFFGQPTGTVDGPARLSLHTGAPIVIGICTRQAAGRFRITAEAVIRPGRSQDRESEVRRITVEINEALERAIRRDPGQWLWFHNRWRSSPEAVVPEDA